MHFSLASNDSPLVALIAIRTANSGPSPPSGRMHVIMTLKRIIYDAFEK